MRCKSGFWSTALCLIVTAACLLPHPSIAGGDSGVTPEIRAALLAEDWGTVARLLDDVGLDHPSAVLRFLKGHACLALNRNNESTCLFLSARDEPALRAWRSWTEGLTRLQPRSATAWYLKGDAWARTGRLEEALRSFDTAHSISPGDALVLNARGVARASMGDLRFARVEMEDAVEASGRRLADAHANLGALCLQRKDGAKGGLEALDEALSINPDFGLALSGRSSIRIVLAATMDTVQADLQISKAAEDLEKAAALINCVDLAILISANSMRYEAFWSGMQPSEYLASLASGGESGTTVDMRSLERRLDAIAANPRGGLWGQWTQINPLLREIYAMSPADQARAWERVNSLRDADTGFRQRFDGGLRESVRWNARGGSAERLNRSSQTLGQGSAMLGYATSNLLLGVGGGITSLGATINEWVRVDMDRGGSNAIRNLHNFDHTHIRPSGGVDTSMDQAAQDSGGWPFAGYFGLAYPVHDDDLPLDEIHDRLRALNAAPDAESTDGISAEEGSQR